MTWVSTRRLMKPWTLGRRQGRSESVIIKNFGQMDGRFYRGGQPRRHQYSQLVSAGITTVINLRDDPQSKEQAAVESLGVRYIHIPMSDRDYPSLKVVASFLHAIDKPEQQRFFVHCAGGRHRTGVIGAVYRHVFNRWEYERAHSEMKKYGFYTRWGHRPLLQFVKDFCSSAHRE